MKPVRLQLSRRKGFSLQALSMATNGLPAKNCARPSRWGNIYVIGGRHPETGEPLTREQAVVLFREYISPFEDIVREELAGFNLACWCKLPKPGEPDICHAVVLLELSNAKET